jgi:hypothetical protein
MAISYYGILSDIERKHVGLYEYLCDGTQYSFLPYANMLMLYQMFISVRFKVPSATPSEVLCLFSSYHPRF